MKWFVKPEEAPLVMYSSKDTGVNRPCVIKLKYVGTCVVVVREAP